MTGQKNSNNMKSKKQNTVTQKTTVLLLTLVILITSAISGNMPVNPNTLKQAKAAERSVTDKLPDGTASNNQGKICSYDNNTKIGKYNYTYDYSKGLYISNKKGSIGKLVLPMNKKGKQFNGDAYVSGNYIYYSYYGGSYNKNTRMYSKIYIYRMKLNGTKKTLLSTIKKKNYHGGKIQLVYKKTIVCTIYGDYDLHDTYCVNIKTKKAKKLNAESIGIRGSQDYSNGIYKGYQYKQYYTVGVSLGEFWYDNVWIYNAKRQKFKTISKKAWDIGIGGKYVYYLEYKNENASCLIRCNVNGKNKKVLKTITEKNPAFYKVTSKYCIYTSTFAPTETYYKYTFSTGKTTKVNIK